MGSGDGNKTYVSGSLYWREDPRELKYRDEVGTAEEMRAKVREAIERLGQPDDYKMIDHEEADVITLKWNSGAYYRLLLKKIAGYQVVYCPHCMRQLFPPGIKETYLKCKCGWVPQWEQDTKGRWMCNTLTFNMEESYQHAEQPSRNTDEEAVGDRAAETQQGGEPAAVSTGDEPSRRNTDAASGESSGGSAQGDDQGGETHSGS